MHCIRTAIDSSLFKQWLENMRSETGILAHGDMSLRRVLIQVVYLAVGMLYYITLLSRLRHFPKDVSVSSSLVTPEFALAYVLTIYICLAAFRVITEAVESAEGVDMFGTRIGFLKFKADVLHNETGNKVPGIVFSRGPAVAVLILLDSGDETYVVLTEQVRVPVGRLILELPAGMLDDDKGDVIGTAVREVEEETGIKLKMADMVNLTSFLDPSTGGKVFPSPGGCDEELSLFMYKGHVDKEVIATLHGKETGLRDHGELIKVRVVPYDKLWRITADAKVLSAITLYEMAKRDGLLPFQ
ncbi:NUDIX hydrolase domain [Macleaya cordata]|uniref:NUDIX hydrolase domain n=1 Tax=Macleaya cordata TaxID=56857 RepID=A0A200PMN8_MACCD|nr:NUDIX hydrolase domain [Macleaya cordata]